MSNISNFIKEKEVSREAAAPDIGLIDPSEAEFYEGAHGFIALRLEGKEYPRISARRALPLSAPERYISICDAESGEEIGILSDLAALSPNNAALVRRELSRRYFCPTVTELLSIREKMGYFYFEVKIGGFPRSFAVKDLSRSIRMHDDRAVIITDVDGNRYNIPDIASIRPADRRRLDPYLY